MHVTTTIAQFLEGGRTRHATHIAAVFALCVMMAPVPLGANGERTIAFYNVHTKETLRIVYKRNGRYVPAALQKLNWHLRDWRQNKPPKMDPALIDLVWEIHTELGSRMPVHVISGYRSPKTNNMLRRRSKVVAKNSQHKRGRAMDFFIPGVKLSELRATGLKMEVGGVGYYPKSGSPFVHMDTGSVRHWPRMTQKQLAKVFPRGDTTHVGTNGRQLKRYNEAKKRQAKLAKVEIAPLNTRRGGMLARLFKRDNTKPTNPTTEQTIASAPTEKAQIASSAPAVPKTKPSETDGPASTPTDLLADTAMQVAYADAPAPRPLPTRLVALRALDKKQKDLVALAALEAEKDKVLAQNKGQVFDSAWSKVGDRVSTDVASLAAPVESAAVKENRSDLAKRTQFNPQSIANTLIKTDDQPEDNGDPKMAKAVLAALDRTRNISGAEPSDTQVDLTTNARRAPASAASIAATILAGNATTNVNPDAEGSDTPIVTAYAPNAPTPLTRPEFTAALGDRRNTDQLRQPIQRAELAPPPSVAIADNALEPDTDKPIVSAALSIPAIQPRQRPQLREPATRAALPSRTMLQGQQQASIQQAALAPTRRSSTTAQQRGASTPTLTGRIPASAARKPSSTLQFNGSEQNVLSSMITPNTTRSEEFARFAMPSPYRLDGAFSMPSSVVENRFARSSTNLRTDKFTGRAIVATKVARLISR